MKIIIAAIVATLSLSACATSGYTSTPDTGKTFVGGSAILKHAEPQESLTEVQRDNIAAEYTKAVVYNRDSQ